MDFFIGLLVGLFFGVLFGFFLVALMFANGNAKHDSNPKKIEAPQVVHGGSNAYKPKESEADK